MATTVRVISKKTGFEREVSYKAYTLIPNSYKVLAFLDAEGNEVPDPKLTPKAATVKKKPVEVVADKKPVGRPKMTDEERAAKKAELERLNQEAIEKAKNKTV